MIPVDDKDNIDILEEEDFNSDRFDRQKRINGWNQERISKATIMIIGAGATGNEVVKNLALAGIGRIILIDYDKVNTSNLSRCVLFNLDASQNEKHEYKVDVIKEACKNLNPETEILSIKKPLNSIDKSLYIQCDVICSCLDNLEARIEANNYAYFYGIPFVDSGIDEFFGAVQAVYSKVPESACLQCGISDKDLDLMWRKFSCTGQELEETERENELKIASIITTTSIIGGIQSQQVLKFLLGTDYYDTQGKWNPIIGEPLVGKQLIYNGVENSFAIINKYKDSKCWTCSSGKNKK